METVLLDVPEAMSVLRCGRTKFYELVRRGDIEIVKLDGRTLVLAESIDAFVARLREPHDPRPVA